MHVYRKNENKTESLYITSLYDTISLHGIGHEYINVYSDPNAYLW